MKRLPDWRLRLDSVLTERVSQPFAWGSQDCCLFAADCVLAMTGADLAEGLRGHQNARQAVRALRGSGGMFKLVCTRLGDSVAARKASAGDVILSQCGKRYGLAVHIGNGVAVAPTARGLGQVPSADWICAWRV